MSLDIAKDSAKTRQGRGRLNRDPLDLIERDFIARAVIELGGARAFVRGHGLRVFEREAGF